MLKLCFMNEKELSVSDVQNHGRIKRKIRTKTRGEIILMINCLNGKQ